MLNEASPKDFEAVCDLAFELYRNTENGLPEVDRFKVVNRLYTAFLDEAPCFVWKEDGKVVGACVLYHDSPWFSEEGYVSDLFTYVKPEYRSIKVWKAFNSACKEYGKLNNRKFVTTLVNPDQIDRKEKLYGRSMKKIGVMFEEEE